MQDVEFEMLMLSHEWSRRYVAQTQRRLLRKSSYFSSSFEIIIELIYHTYHDYNDTIDKIKYFNNVFIHLLTVTLLE